MVKGLRAAAAALLFTVVSEAAQAQAAAKFAYVDSRVILQRAPGRQQAQSQFEREMNAWQAQVKVMGDSLRAMVSAYEKAESTLTAPQKEVRQKEIRDKQTEYQTRTQELEQKAQEREMELVQPIMTQIREVLDRMRAEEGYMFIFDVGASSGMIVAADKNLDITERVIARLRPVTTSSKPDSAKPPPAGARPQPAGVTRPPIRPPTP
jgi:outer membrane protein